MYKGLITVLLLLITSSVFAGQKDSLFVTLKNTRWVVMHTIKQGETIFDVANRYHVPAGTLAGENNIGFQTPLTAGSQMAIPLGAYNRTPGMGNAAYRNVYYRVKAEDNLYKISKMAGETQRTLQEWNELPDNNVYEGDVIVVVKLVYDGGSAPTVTSYGKPFAAKTDTFNKKQGSKDSTKAPKYTVSRVAKEVMENGKKVTYLVNDTVWADTLGPYARAYMEQTLNETKITEEKGTAVFYTANKVQSRYNPSDANKKVYIYAFHKTALRGTIIKVYNPASDKLIYVKVMGALPDTKQYANSEIGISADAKEMLGVSVMEDRAWVELKYAGK
jgi:LysM repeat protein